MKLQHCVFRNILTSLEYRLMMSKEASMKFCKIYASLSMELKWGIGLNCISVEESKNKDVLKNC